MSSIVLRGLVGAVLSTIGGGAVAAEDVVDWQGKSRKLEEIRAEIGAPTGAAIDAWLGWCAQAGYRMALSDDQRVLLIFPAQRSGTRRSLDLVEMTLRHLDKVTPPPQRMTDAAGDSVPPGFSAEDIFGTSPEPQQTEAPPVWRWSDPSNPIETDTAVMVLFGGQEDYESGLDHLARGFAYLGDWLPSGKKFPGCVLERPLFGGVVENAAGQEEWSADNELVHRVAQLHLLRRFGHQPVWVALGMGWSTEQELLKSIYCFPWRTGFVYVAEHGGWEAALHKMFQERKKDQPLRMFELASCRRGEFDQTCATLSWGMARFLTEFYPEQLSQVLEEFRVLRNTKGRTYQTNAAWTIDPSYELPVELQEEVLKRVVAADVLEQASDWFRMGKKWKRPKR